MGTIYGMNFDHMPELHRAGGYPFAVVLMAVVCTSLYMVFKKKDWLWRSPKEHVHEVRWEEAS